MSKKHISFWIEDKDLKECDANVIASDYESRSEYIAEAVSSIICTYITKIMKNILINISEIICPD